jgi:transposase
VGCMDISTATREELLALVIRQQETIAELQSTVAELRDRLREFESDSPKGPTKGMPGLKPESAKRSGSQKQPRRKRPHGFARLRSRPTERIVHALDECPDCHTHLVGGSIKRRREVIDVPVQPAQVVEHAYVERHCPLCQKRVMPKVSLEGVVVGKARLGVNLVSLIVSLREQGRLPVRTIQWYLETFHEVKLSVGAIVDVTHNAAELGEKAALQIRDQIRASQVVMADETGLRENGHNGFAWIFTSADGRYFVRRGRNKEVVDEVLGDEFDGVLVTDFYAAYHHYEGLHQRCWAHLLRDIHELKLRHPSDDEVWRWGKAVHKVYEEAKSCSGSSEAERLRAQQHLEQELMKACEPFLGKEVPQRRLCERVEAFLSELFVFVAIPGVPSDNNGAERGLRHLVTSRKISGGTRSARGSDTKMILSTLFGTWSVRNINPFLACRQLFSSPQL